MSTVIVSNPLVGGVPIPLVVTSVGGGGGAARTYGADVDVGWTLLRAWGADTPTSVNTRPAPGDFIAISGQNETHTAVQVLAKLMASPVAAAVLYVWIDDGVDVWCLNPVVITSRAQGISSQDPYGPLDGALSAQIAAARRGSTAKVAAVVAAAAATSTFTAGIASSALATITTNQGFVGGELVTFSTTGTLPTGLSGSISALDEVADTITLSGVYFADGEPVRANRLVLPSTGVPPLGLAAYGYCSKIDTVDGWFALEPAFGIDLKVGDTVRFRAGGGSTLPALNTTVITATATLTVVNVAGSSFQIGPSISTVNTITSVGTGLYYVFKYPYDDVFFKGTNQLSRTLGGPAIDFGTLYTAVAVVVTPGTAAVVTHAGHSFLEGQVVTLTANTVPAGSAQGQSFYVRNPLVGSYNISANATGSLAAFTSAGTSVRITGLGAVTAVTVTAGTPGSIALAQHWLSSFDTFVLGGTLPAGYSGQFLWPLVLSSDSFTFTDNRLTPCTFTDAGASVTLTTRFRSLSELLLERRTAYVALTPAPTDTTIAFSYTPGGGGITPIGGGTGAHTLTAAAPTIKSGSYVRIRPY